MSRGPTPNDQDFSGEATNPGYAGLTNTELGDLGVPGYQNYGGAGEQRSLWDKLTDAAGNLGSSLPKASMPGTTVGAPAGQAAPALPAPLQFPGQMSAPRGMGAYFQALQNPPAGGGSNLIAQYAALQQLMRGG